MFWEEVSTHEDQRLKIEKSRHQVSTPNFSSQKSISEERSVNTKYRHQMSVAKEVFFGN